MSALLPPTISALTIHWEAQSVGHRHNKAFPTGDTGSIPAQDTFYACVRFVTKLHHLQTQHF